MNFLRSLFVKPHVVTMIRDGHMYRQTYKSGRLVKEKLVDEHGGFEGLNEKIDAPATGDRTVTDLYNEHIPAEPVNLTKKPENI